MNLRPYTIDLLTIPGQHSIRPLPFKPTVVLVLVAGERAATFPGGRSPQVDRRPAHCLRATSGRTNTPLLPPGVQLDSVASVSRPLFSELCTMFFGTSPQRVDIWYYTKYIWLNGVRTTNRGQTNTRPLPPVQVHNTAGITGHPVLFTFSWVHPEHWDAIFHYVRGQSSGTLQNAGSSMRSS